ncbi:helix-turn-helix domain-containing protein [Thermoanaerobacterium thermosulfurigenes]|uniref:helix-turn-helix domain-containing protein n=1 Tax=Thermoanaerobacterium thermosulfurigenes TaxID=33950 RepID=UPI003EFB26C3
MELTSREEYIIKRKRKKIKLKDLAQALNCSEALICKYEKGHLELKADMLEAYQNYIDVR